MAAKRSPWRCRLRPALIVLDLMMPNMSGFEVVKRLQSHTETAAIPILVVTDKQITAQDRAALNGNAGKMVRVVEKAGFNNELFIAEVRRTLQATLERTSRGNDIDH